MTAQRAALRLARLPASCHYCGKRLEGDDRTKDHIVPRSKGGPDASWNYVQCCVKWNRAKGNKWPEDHCPRCCQAKYRFEQMPQGFLAGIHRGPRCKDCGRITMTPADCTWCATDA